MTEEMTIQPQVRQSNPLVPTLIGGAIGAGGGATAAHFINKHKGAMSYEELVAEVKDKTDFSTKKEPAKWSDFKAKSEKIASLEKQIAEMPEKMLPENHQLAKDKAHYQKLFDEELARRIEAEEAKLGKTTAGNLVLEKQLNTTLSVSEMNQIKSEMTAYNNAVANLRGKDGGSAVKAEFKAVDTARKEAAKLYEVPVKTSLGTRNLHKQATNLANSILKDQSSLSSTKNLAEIQRLAQEFGNVYSISTEPVKGGYVIKDAYGTGKHAWVTVDKKALGDARQEMIKALKENAEQYKVLANELADIETNFFKENETALKELGVNKKTELATFNPKGDLRKNILNLEDKIKIAERSGCSFIQANDPITGKFTSYTTLDQAKEALEKGHKKLELATEYQKLRAPKVAEQHRLINANPKVKAAKATYQEAIANNPALKNAINNIKNKLTGKRAPANGAEIWAKLQPLLEAEATGATGTVDKAAIENLLKE